MLITDTSYSGLLLSNLNIFVVVIILNIPGTITLLLGIDGTTAIPIVTKYAPS